MDHRNKIAIPLDRIEDALRDAAVPGFWGSIRIEVRLNPSAALEVDLLTEKTSVTEGITKTREVANVVPVMNDRFARVKLKIAELAEKFYIVCPVTRIEGIFEDGKIVRFEVTEVKEVTEPKMRFQVAPAVAK